MEVIRIGTLGPRMRGRRPPVSVGRCPHSGKDQYTSEDDALSAAISFATNNGYRLTSNGAYICRRCGRWHHTKRT